ncbi:hypothetical protein ACHAXT_008080 [Thalassiosira profunda]
MADATSGAEDAGSSGASQADPLPEAAEAASPGEGDGGEANAGAAAGVVGEDGALQKEGASDVVATDGDAAAGEGGGGGEHAHHEEEHEDDEVHDMEGVHNPRNLTWDELEMLLYEWEEEVTSVNEYLDPQVLDTLRKGETDDWEDDSYDDEEEEPKGWMSRLKRTAHYDDGSKTKVEFKHGPTHYLNLTEGAAHVVEFYAPWCPHCQNYKWDYVAVAAEVTRRSTTPVEFHAVSCDIYYAICSTYEIDGFPLILGWKAGDSFAERGIYLNEEEEITADIVAYDLELDLAHENVELFDWGFEDNETMAHVEKKLAEQGHKAAAKKLSWHEHEPHTHNDRYHNAALSLAFAIKSQLFQTVTEEGKMQPKSKAALTDFLNLLEWATPQSWKLRSTFVKELQWKMGTNGIKGRGDVESIINGDTDRHRAEGTEDLWGFVDATTSGWTGKVKTFSRKAQQKLAKDDKHWTKTCTHHQPAKGFTCGLWNLFHILTIGSAKPEHELYGFHRGYFVTPHHVAETIRNFVAYFFSCDVCRTNFLNMYDSCGHDHCNRLKSEITVGPVDGSDPARMELALWLWEVHNSVNARLMKEAAARQNREVSHEETLASKFPTKNMCPDCWLDANMTKWDNATVFRFLDEWYWPADEVSDMQFKSVAAGAGGYEEMPDHVNDRSPHGTAKPSTFASSKLFAGFASAFCLIAFALLAARKKRREQRKKFVDSRFVQKKPSRSLC